MLANVGDDETLATELVGALDTRAQDGMILGRIASDHQDQACFFDIGDGAGVTAVAYGALQPHGCGVLAVARAVVDVVGADDGAGELLHEEALFVGALGRGYKAEGIGAVIVLDLGELLLDEVERFVP